MSPSLPHHTHKHSTHAGFDARARFLIPSGAGTAAGDEVERFSAYFNGANFALLGLLGLACVCGGTTEGESLHEKDRSVVSLGNMRAFLTFVLVTMSTVAAFNDGAASGPLLTAGYDPKPGALFLGPEGTFSVGALWFTAASQYYILSALCFLHGHLCAMSLDLKGFKIFVINRCKGLLT